MAIILLHSSKSMRQADASLNTDTQLPELLDEAKKLQSYLRTLPVSTLATTMKLSDKKAVETRDLIAAWTADSSKQRPAIDTFLGDIYSGLQAASFTADDREYANDHLYILSGLYGLLRALDGVYPYRLEMGYKLPDEPFSNLYQYWGDKLATILPADQPIVNLSAVEYTKALLPYVSSVIISPKFLTRHSKTNEPTFVTVHAKVARGAFAHWMITHRIESLKDLKSFSELNYSYDASLSTETEPVFVCDTFGGLGMSVRLS